MLHRMKIGLGAAVVLLAVTLLVYASVSSHLKRVTLAEVEDNVARAQRLHHQIARLDGNDFANLAASLARRPGVVGVFDGGDAAARLDAAFEESEKLNEELAKNGAKADLVAILDGGGKVIARDLNPKAMIGDDLKSTYPSVGRALGGVAAQDIWNFSNRMTRTAVAPVTGRDGKTAGVLLLGYVVTTKDAQAKRDLLGADVAYYYQGKVHTSSFVAEGEGANAKEDGNKTQALNEILFKSSEKPGQAALDKGAPTEVFNFKMDGQEYVGVAAPWPGNAFDKSAGVAVVKSIDGAVARLSGAGSKVIAFGLLAILIAVGGSVLTAIRFVKPLGKIELGVAEIINGNIDYQFKPVGPDFEGLSNSLNVMLARLLGRDDPDENAVEEDEDEGKPRWRGEQMVIDESPPSSSQPTSDPALLALANESESDHYSRLYNEYVAALRAKGRPIEGISIQQFTAKLRLAEGGLKQKWKCRAVRFALTPDATIRALGIF